MNDRMTEAEVEELEFKLGTMFGERKTSAEMADFAILALHRTLREIRDAWSDIRKRSNGIVISR